MPEEKPSSSSGTRSRRGSRGGRGRRSANASANEEQQPSGSDGPDLSAEPRVVRRRPATAKTAAADSEPAAAAAAEEAPKPRTRRRRAAASTATEPAEQPAETDAEAQTTASRSRSGSATRTRSRRSAATEEKSEQKTNQKADEPAAETAAKPRRSARSTAKSAQPAADGAADGAADDIATLSAALSRVQETVDSLGERLERATQRARLGVFVDVPNVLYGAEGLESQFDMGKLLAYLSEGRELVRATAYSPVSDDPSEPMERQRFVAPFVPYEYRIVTKPLKRFADGSIKGNFDVEMAIDMLTMAERLDVIACVSGDSDFARLVEVIQGRGVRVEVVAFSGSTSAEMRALADRYVDLGAIIDQLLHS